MFGDLEFKYQKLQGIPTQPLLGQVAHLHTHFRFIFAARRCVSGFDGSAERDGERDHIHRLGAEVQLLQRECLDLLHRPGSSGEQ